MFLTLLASAQDQSAALIPVFASDSHGHPIPGLTVGSLRIFDDKGEIKAGAKLIHGSDVPLRLGILIDSSGSERDSSAFDQARAISKDFASQLLRWDQDRVFFLTFSETSQATGWLTKEQIGAVSLPDKPHGGTRLYDAVAMACEQRMGRSGPRNPLRRALVIFSDGEDNASHSSLTSTVALAIESGVVIFTVHVAPFTSVPRRGARVLKELSDPTAGLVFGNVAAGDLPKVMAAIKEQIDGMYYLTYSSPPTSSKNGIHNVEIKPAQGVKADLRFPARYLQ